MAKFKDKIKKVKPVIGNKIVNSDEAMGAVFKDSGKKISTVKISALQKNPHQPRLSINQSELEGLASSIKENGLLQPIIISPINNSSKNFYIVAGHRRVEAHKLLGREEIEAVIEKFDDENLKIYSILENLQRENLTAYEESLSIKKLVDSGMKQKDLVDKLGKSKGYISKMIKISTLNPKVIEYINSIENLKIGMSILFEISNVTYENQLDALKYIIKKSMSRDQISEYVKKLNGSNSDKKVSPGKLLPYSFKSKGSKVSFKLDLNRIKDDEKETVIKELEKLIEQLKKEN